MDELILNIRDIQRNMHEMTLGRFTVRWYSGLNPDFITWGVLRDKDLTLISLGRLEIEWSS